jgi:hypothetical protein
MTNSTASVTAEHTFALHSGEKARLHFWSDHHTSIRLISKTFPKDFNLVADVCIRLPSGCAAHPEGILAKVGEAAAALNDKSPSFWSDFRSLAETMLEREISILKIKSQAKALIDEYGEAAALEQDVMASREKQGWLQQVRTDLGERIDRLEDFPNKQFRGLGEATARCLQLYHDHPDAYAALVSPICVDEGDVFLDSLRGLATLEHLVRGLADDHNFVFNPATKAVEYQRDATGSLPGLVPVTFLEIVKAAQAAAAAAKSSVAVASTMP